MKDYKSGEKSIMHEYLSYIIIKENIEIKSNDILTNKLIKLFLSNIGFKSKNTANHCIRVCRLSCKIGNAYNLSKVDMKNLFIASVIHDIGKIFTPDEILNRPFKLTEDEYKIIKEHSKKGFDIVSEIETFKNISKIILYHHERYDGNGYPHGLSKEDIPFLSRIISVANAFDVMTSNKPYRRALGINDSIKELEDGRYTQFDGEIVDVFIDLIKKGEIYK